MVLLDKFKNEEEPIELYDGQPSCGRSILLHDDDFFDVTIPPLPVTCTSVTPSAIRALFSRSHAWQSSNDQI